MKPASQSLTIQAIVVNMLIKLAAGVGLNVTADDLSQLVVWGGVIVALIPDIIAWYGRVRARDRISPKPDDSHQLYSLLALICLPLALLAGGCIATPEALDADRQRREALVPVVEFYVEHHPIQAQTWADFMRTWERSYRARGGQ